MIRKIKFNNFYSFKKEQVLDFTTKRQSSYSYYNSKFGDQISRIIGFIGPNASGKTNVIRSLSFVAYFVTNTEHSNLGLNGGFKNFFNSKEATNFYIEFELSNILFYYDFSIKDGLVVKESLYAKSLEKYSRKDRVFIREGNRFDFLSKHYIGNLEKKFVNIKSNVSAIAFFNSLSGIDVVNIIYKYFSQFKTNINERGQIHSVDNQVNSLKLFLKDKEIQKEINNFISNFDVGLQGFDIREKNELNETTILASGMHEINKNHLNLAFEYESRGTQLLFFNLVKILYAVKNNSYVVIDELEYGLHPEAFNKLISYFIDEKADKSTQLFFSSHSFGFLNIMDFHQIFLTEKNNDCESEVSRLDSIDGIRSDENYLTKYMSGAYGAFPKIRI